MSSSAPHPSRSRRPNRRDARRLTVVPGGRDTTEPRPHLRSVDDPDLPRPDGAPDASPDQEEVMHRTFITRPQQRYRIDRDRPAGPARLDGPDLPPSPDAA